MAGDVEMPDAMPQDEEERHRQAAEEGHNTAEEEDSSEEESSDGEPYLAVTRERRPNAGNRMARLLELAEAEQATEEYGEIFQEAANDQEFEEQDEGDEDVNMESSSDEDEADGEQDEDTAEKEIKRQEKRENAKKQKRQSLLQQMMKKRTSAAVASAAVATAAGVEAGPSSSIVSSRPKKKSERVSWLPEDEQQATRASSRKLAVLNKQATHERLKEKEKHRLRTVAIMKAAEQKKEATKPKALTQADRLAEAARIERENSRSVRKWEEIERRKEEERKAKLAASKNRKLEGPVISYYSGPALWVDDKLKHVGKSKIIADVLKESRDSSNRPNATINGTETKTEDQEPILTNDGHKLHEESAVNQQLSSNPHCAPSPPSTAPEPPKPGFLDGIHFYPSLPVQETTSTHAAGSSVPSTGPSAPSTGAPAPSVTPSSTLQTDSTSGATISDILTQQHQQTAASQPSTIPPAQSPTAAEATLSTPSQLTESHPKPLPAPPKHQPTRSISARTLITLLNFQPEPKPRDRDALLRALLSTPTHPYIPPPISRWSNRLAPAKRSLCAITDNAARYRDPLTGLTYADGYALRVIRRLVRHGEKVDGKRGGYVWCATLGCWVGEKGRAAVGVPAGFLDPAKVKKEGAKDEGGVEKMDVTA